MSLVDSQYDSESDVEVVDAGPGVDLNMDEKHDPRFPCCTITVDRLGGGDVERLETRLGSGCHASAESDPAPALALAIGAPERRSLDNRLE
jgi:hypothetical protein